MASHDADWFDLSEECPFLTIIINNSPHALVVRVVYDDFTVWCTDRFMDERYSSGNEGGEGGGG